MPSTRSRTILKYLLIASGISGVLLATLIAFFGILGVIGVLADVGPDENRDMGTQALWIASIPFGLGVIAIVGGLLIGKSGRTN